MDSDHGARAIAESAYDAFIAMDDQGRIVEWNLQAEKTFGWRRNEVVGLMLSDTVIPARYREAHRKGLAHYLKTGQGPVLNHRLELSALHRLGHEIPVEMTIYPIHQKEGILFGSFLHDITEKKQNEEKVRALQAELEMKVEARTRDLALAFEQAQIANQLKDEFLATVSHELRTPLGVIQGHSDMLLEGDLTPEEIENSIQTIHRNTRAQTQIINDLLDVSSIITGKLHLEMETVPLDTAVLAAVNSVQFAASAKDLKVRTEIEPLLGPIRGDPNRLQQVLWNLLSNAVKFTPKGGVIEIKLYRQGSHVNLEVRDSGKGIAPEFLPFVYDRFRQEDSSTTRRHGGLGLGLAIVRHIVEGHGGSIEAQSAGPNQGAKFILSFPLMEVTAQNLSSSQMEFLGKAQTLEGESLLVIDDEVDTRKMLGLILERAGAHVYTAGGLDEALELFEVFHPAVVVSDISMPDHDGFEVISQLRKLPSEHHQPFLAVALTAHAREEERAKILAAGFDLHLTKPIQPQELVAHLSGLISRTKAENSSPNSTNF